MRRPAVFFLLAAPLLAQTPVTSPKGFDMIEGNTVFFHWGANRRFQQIDNTHTGGPLLIRSFAVRRNGGVAQTAPPRTLDFSLDMGRCDFSVVSQDFERNYLPNTRQTVVPQTRVNMPDWSALLPGPAPFDFKIPFPQPYIYIGQNAIVIDFTIQNPTVTTLAQTDREYGTPAGGLAGAAGAQFGAGCVSTGQTSSFDHKTAFMNQGPTPDPRFALRFRVSGDFAPANAPTIAFIDTQDRNVTGVVCSTVHAFPTLFAVTVADAAGKIPETFLGYPYDASLEGASVISQLVAIDMGQPRFPVSVSNGVRTMIPFFQAGLPSHPTTYSWYTLPGPPNFVFFGGGMVIELG